MIRRELAIFLIVGSLTVLLDFLVYRGLVWTEMLSLNMAKGIGFLAGTVFSYFANRFWTFGHKVHAAGSAWRFGLLYATSLGANVLANSTALTALPPMATSIQVAFLLATGVSTILNFLGMKLFVFNAATATEMR